MNIACLFLIFTPALHVVGYQLILESKGFNNPLLSLSLYKTTILIDIALKLCLVLFVHDIEIYTLISTFTIFTFSILFFVNISLKIPRKKIRNIRKYPQETKYTPRAIELIAWGILSLAFNIIIVFMNWSFEDSLEVKILCYSFALIALLYHILAAKALIRLDRLKKPAERSLNALSHNNAPIVLLRSFKIDAYPSMSGEVFDEEICKNLDLENNPIVSLANPDEILPSGGSLKIQAKDSEWKEVVKEILKNCRAVIIVEGLSDGLHWEISKLKEYLLPSQLFVMIPSKKYRELAWCYNEETGSGLYSITRNVYRIITALILSNRKDNNKILNLVWSDFSSTLNEHGIHTPEKFPGNNCILCFDSNWNCFESKKLHDMRSMLELILTRTKSFNNSDFDYPKLSKKIESYEVNSFQKKETYPPLKRLVNKFNVIGRIAAIICSVIFLTTIIFF